MVWLDLVDAACPAERVVELGKEAGLKLFGNRLVIHYQIYQNRDYVLPRLEKVFRGVMEEKANKGGGSRTETGNPVGEPSQYRVR